jgi:hypothetical protein
MTDEQINVAIAEACGWKKPARKTVLNEKGFFVTQHAQSAPNYCNDLNAMHEAEELSVINLHDYGMHLYQIVVPLETRVFVKNDPNVYIWHATARQRAEAFLRTLGKWEEAK